MNTFELNFDAIKKVIGETGYSLNRRKNTYVTPFPTRNPERANFEAGFSPVMAAVLRVIGNESKYYERNDQAVEEIIENGKFDQEPSKAAFANYLKNEMKEIENGNVYKFEQLKYIPFTETSKEAKGELMYFHFFYDLFIRQNIEEIQEIFSAVESQDLLSTIMNLTMVEQANFDEPAQYKQLFPFMQKQFVEDLRVLATNPTFLITNLEEFFVQYCYFALTQMIVQTNRYTKFNAEKPFPVVLFLNTESTQKWRDGYRYGYKLLKEEFRYFYAHEHVLNILGANTFADNGNWFYHDYATFFKEQGPEAEQQFVQSIYQWIEEVMAVRIDDVTPIPYKHQTLEEAFRDLVELVRLQVKDEVYSRYTKAFDMFLRRFYRKNGGSLGSLLAVSPKQLLTMIAVCVGPKNSRLELNYLWAELEKRGVFLDDQTKEEVVHLLDQLNYLDKKSDSGDAQYVKAIL
ncbi:DNA phosphorothioation-dependent restriction protein DptG [Candidatus Kurthia intestinigallinarum]|uniref:DNA phosphorothioation-dependent restriction protein DptG n=1 Tax=Candidatus Kurthia intestinigallinarum TaxID=1562256 RepID=UPI000F8E8519|nr:DNA phosphorothioation-dependent restriction protein DptG [Kurthia sp. 3B1D]